MIHFSRTSRRGALAALLGAGAQQGGQGAAARSSGKMDHGRLSQNAGITEPWYFCRMNWRTGSDW